MAGVGWVTVSLRKSGMGAVLVGRVNEWPAILVALASPAAAYITGETIHVNGGMYCA